MKDPNRLLSKSDEESTPNQRCYQSAATIELQAQEFKRKILK